MSIQATYVADLVGSVDVPCNANYHAGDAPASWIFWQFVCCPARPKAGLICDPCLAFYESMENAIRCPDCGHRTSPGRLVIERVEPINLPPVA